MSDRPDYEQIDHTGDVGIVVRAPDLPALYSRAALALCDLLTDLRTVRAETGWAIQAEAPDREALMVRWLSEVLFLHDARRIMFRRFTVEALEPGRIVATGHGERLDPERHVVRTEIKAVTYHHLLVAEEGPGRWSARVIFDV